MSPAVAALLLLLVLQAAPPAELPPAAQAKLRENLKSAAVHTQHLWRDTPPFDGELLNGYIEIPLGGRTKFELDMAKNAPAIDREIPAKIGGYPVNYGIVPQTVSYDGDPFDVLVLGPPIKTGERVQGVIVGLMHMTDEKGLDSKVVISRVGKDGKPLHRLTDADRERMADYFNRYKRDDDDPQTFATVPGWGTAAEGLAFVRRTHEFFRQAVK
jgi:inorganic pyrophosphatase